MDSTTAPGCHPKLCRVYVGGVTVIILVLWVSHGLIAVENAHVFTGKPWPLVLQLPDCKRPAYIAHVEIMSV